MTLPLDTVIHIRRLFFAEHWKVGTIVEHLKVHPEAVARAIGTDTFVSRGREARQKLLEPYIDVIAQTLS